MTNVEYWRNSSLNFRYISPADDPLVFRGLNRQECEEFVFAIHQRATDLRDPKGTASLAALCFSGKSLEWYMTLDDRIKNHWGLLAKALFREYGGYQRQRPTPQ
jgi:hypothetical protein